MDLRNPYDGDESPVKITAWLLAAVGAINWGLMELIDLNLVTEIVSPSTAGVIYIVIGAAGALSLAGDIGIDVLGGDSS